MENDINNNYLLREFFKGFKIENEDLIKIKEKINKCDRSVILDRLLNQGSGVYNLIAENYLNTVEMVSKNT